jgi:hypothetical protein
MTIDSETQEWQDTMADWAEATHGEIRSIRARSFVGQVVGVG